ncbi:MAG TPA: hypothetical protein VNE39_25620 [Planctomycetota bacterium]|nr:hypothetical protein [Planctomycetota bacterium]
MPHSEGPEEFFKVLREVQQGKAKHEGAGGPAEPAPAGEPSEGPLGTLALSYPAALGGVVIVVLLVVLGYLLGRQHGWNAYEAALKHQAARAVEKATTAAPAKAAPQGQAPEVIEGMVFTLLTLQKSAADRESVQKEAEYLNKYAPFKALGLEAYAWRDTSGKYRLCARGFANMDDATRKQVRDQVRNLVSRQGRREYRDSDFLPQ